MQVRYNANQIYLKNPIYYDYGKKNFFCYINFHLSTFKISNGMVLYFQETGFKITSKSDCYYSILLKKFLKYNMFC